ncbi:adhesion G protein-coupled receptor L1-like [Glandiceps talaboti]
MLEITSSLDFDPNAVKCAVNSCLNGGTCINILAHGYESPVMCSGTRCYEFVRRPSNWQEASLSCMEKSATLVALETTEEMDIIKSYVIDNELYVSTNEKITGFWTGGNDIAREGVWMWSGLDHSVTSWQPESPDPRDNPRVQNCLELNTEYLEDYDFRWKASQCADKKYSICETSIQQIIADAQQFRELACNNDVLSLRCPSDINDGVDEINVLTAEYGRWSHSTTSELCTSEGVDSDSITDSCRFNSSRARHAVSVFCNGRQECSFIVSSSTMGFTSDICPHTYKYAEVLYECREPNSLPTIECERDRGQRISCETNNDKPFIFIEYANYGRLERDICTSVQGVSTGECRSMTSLVVVSERCNGRKVCTLSADNVYFGDPCTGVYKYLEVRYRCVDQAPERDWYPLPDGFPVIIDPEYCPDTSIDGITWPETRQGHTAAALCPENKEGLVYLKCLSNPAQWNPEGADFASCISGWVNKANEMIHDNLPAQEIAASVDRETNTEDTLNSKDIEDTVSIIDDLLHLQKIQMLGMDDNEIGTNTMNFTEGVFSVGSNLLDRDNVAKWIQIPGEKVSASATKLVHNLEESAMLLANQLEKEDKVHLRKQNIVMQVMSLQTGNDKHVDPVQLDLEVVNEGGKREMRQVTVTLPDSILEQSVNKSEFRKVTFLAYNNLEDLLTSQGSLQEESKTGSEDGNSELAKMAVNTMVTAVSIDEVAYTKLGGEVHIVLEHLKESKDDNSTCAFWNYSERMHHIYSLPGYVYHRLFMLQVLCSVLAGLMHYFFLASFAWMCLEGIQLYIMLVLVFAQEKSRIYLYYLFGYGFPLIIVGISAGIRYDGYGTELYCWLTTKYHLIWSFVGPVAAIALVNIVFLVMALRVAYAHRSIAAKDDDSVSHKVRMWAKGAVILVCILGVTWITGLMFVNEDSVAIAYIFTLLNSFQGLFIFIFHCLLNDKVKKELDKRMRRSRRVPSFIRDKYVASFPQTSAQVVSTTLSQSQGAKHGESCLSVTSTLSESVEISNIRTRPPRDMGTSGEYTVS